MTDNDQPMSERDAYVQHICQRDNTTPERVNRRWEQHYNGFNLWRTAWQAALQHENGDHSNNKPCTMGMGCEEAGVCFAEAHGEPERCPTHKLSTLNPPQDCFAKLLALAEFIVDESGAAVKPGQSVRTTAASYVSDFLGQAALQQEPRWRCFHCDMTFTDKAEAQKHFGEFSSIPPECIEFFKENGTTNLVQKYVEQGKKLVALQQERGVSEVSDPTEREKLADYIDAFGDMAVFQSADLKLIADVLRAAPAGDERRTLERLICEFEALERVCGPTMQVSLGLQILRAALSRVPSVAPVGDELLRHVDDMVSAYELAKAKGTIGAQQNLSACIQNLISHRAQQRQREVES